MRLGTTPTFTTFYKAFRLVTEANRVTSDDTRTSRIGEGFWNWFSAQATEGLQEVLRRGGRSGVGEGVCVCVGEEYAYAGVEVCVHGSESGRMRRREWPLVFSLLFAPRYMWPEGP